MGGPERVLWRVPMAKTYWVDLGWHCGGYQGGGLMGGHESAFWRVPMAKTYLMELKDILYF